MISINKASRPLAMFDYSDDGKNVVVRLMQHGDKFSVTEKIADEWLANISMQALSGQYDPQWVAQFKLEYEAFKSGNELPREGMPIRTWAAIRREQQTRLIALNITTVEDLAGVPDSNLGVLGLDGRVLRDLAKNTLDKGGDLAKRLSDAEQSGREKDEIIKRMEDRLAALEKDKTLTLPKKAA